MALSQENNALLIELGFVREPRSALSLNEVMDAARAQGSAAQTETIKSLSEALGRILAQAEDPTHDLTFPAAPKRVMFVSVIFDNIASVARNALSNALPNTGEQSQ